MQEAAVNRIVHLLLTQQKGEITEAEQQELDAWAGASEANRRFIERCLDREGVAASLEQLDKTDEEAAWQSFILKNGLDYTITPVVSIGRRKPWQWVAAAATIGVLATGAYLFFNKGGNSKPRQEEVVTVDKGERIQPGTNKATLTLNDGRTITLDEAKDGTLAKEGGAAINKKGDALVYDPEAKGGKGAAGNAPVAYNTVSTPRGGFYALTLPDGSKVWLNAEASIRFPTAFTGKERRVDITGEAYFEVAKRASQPFIVSTGDAQVRVLGTHFNIRAYADEGAIKTTLVEGSVEVTATEAAKKVILKPAQQAILSHQSQSSQSIPVQTADVESVIAWKNGYFDFKAVPLSDILKEIKRWYQDIDDIEVKMPANEAFTAAIPRNVPLSTMLTILESTDRVHFEVKGKTIVVTR